MEEGLKEDRNNLPWKLIAIVALAVSGVIAGGLILTFGGADSIQKAGVMFAFLAAIIGPLVALQVQEVHKTVNSRLGQWRRETAITNSALLALTEKLALEHGRIQGRAEQVTIEADAQIAAQELAEVIPADAGDRSLRRVDGIPINRDALPKREGE